MTSSVIIYLLILPTYLPITNITNIDYNMFKECLVLDEKQQRMEIEFACSSKRSNDNLIA